MGCLNENDFQWESVPSKSCDGRTRERLKKSSLKHFWQISKWTFSSYFHATVVDVVVVMRAFPEFSAHFPCAPALRFIPFSPPPPPASLHFPQDQTASKIFLSDHHSSLDLLSLSSLSRSSLSVFSLDLLSLSSLSISLCLLFLNLYLYRYLVHSFTPSLSSLFLFPTLALFKPTLALFPI